jgi:hypothetical protein
MLSLLRSGKSRDLENVVAHSQPNYVKPVGDLRIASDNSVSSGGPSFFERLFGGPSQYPPAPVGRRRGPPPSGQSYYQR